MSNEYIGSCGLDSLRSMSDRLNAQVIEQVNDTQELVMMNNFARDINEYQFRQSLQDRMSDIASWRWVLEDLSKRLDEAIESLRYEHNALRVVIERVQDEIDVHSRDATRPGALSPMTDSVEDAIIQEFNFLREQKKKFETMVIELEKQIKIIQRTNKKIGTDVLNKQHALSIEEACANIDLNTLSKVEVGKKKKKRVAPLSKWENRCVSLKKVGLKALSNAVITRQQVRGARVHLSIAAQAYAVRVDAALRRRTHSNKVNLQDLTWQKEEAKRDMKSLQDELTTTEQNIMETMEQQRIVEARLADRTFRPAGELTRDDVDRKLRDELARLRSFNKQLTSNHERILCLQSGLSISITQLDCCIEDIKRVIQLDDQRMRTRLGEPQVESIGVETVVATALPDDVPSPGSRPDAPLTCILEEDEIDDYPFDT